MPSKQATVTGLTILCLLSGLFLGACAIPRIVQVEPEPEPIMQTRGSGDLEGITHFNNLSTTDLTVADDAAIVDLTITGATSLVDLTVTGAPVLDDTAVNLAADTTITPTAGFYHVSATKAVTITLAACSANGQLLFLFGDDNQTVTIADSHIRTTTGSALTLGQYDLVLFACADTEWVELALAADS